MPERSVSLSELEALAAQVLGAGHAFRFRARGASMQPFLRDGDVVEVRPVDGGRVCRGDVVLCRDGHGRLLVHRVIRVARQAGQVSFLTRGDALLRPDGPVSQGQILGRVAAVERAGKWIAIHTRPRRLAGLLHPALLPLFAQVSRIRRALHARRPACGPHR